jgi:LacI family transcriptional regulator
MSRATLKDVAAHAGVSHQTVSNVLNNHPSIRPTMRERVLHSIRALDYHPNTAAKALREARSTTLCCVFYKQPAQDIEDPYRNLIQSALMAETANYGYSLTTAFLDDRPESFAALRRAFLQRQFGGGVVVGFWQLGLAGGVV